MSKRLKNYPDPTELVNETGADALRLYLLSSPVVAAESIKFSAAGVSETLKASILPFFHSFRFFVQETTRYEISSKRPFAYDEETVNHSPDKSILDCWILAAVNQLNLSYVEEMEDYKLYAVGPKIVSFLERLTNCYVRLNRSGKSSWSVYWF